MGYDGVQAQALEMDGGVLKPGLAALVVVPGKMEVTSLLKNAQQSQHDESLQAALKRAKDAENKYDWASAKAGYEAANWAASLWVRNAFDAHYATRGFFFGNEPPDWTPKRYIDNGDPRQLGVSVSYFFR